MDGVNTGVNTNLEDGIAIGLDAYQGPLDTPVWLDEAAAAPYGVTAGYYLFRLNDNEDGYWLHNIIPSNIPLQYKEEESFEGCIYPELPIMPAEQNPEAPIESSAPTSAPSSASSSALPPESASNGGASGANGLVNTIKLVDEGDRAPRLLALSYLEGITGITPDLTDPSAVEYTVRILKTSDLYDDIKFYGADVTNIPPHEPTRSAIRMLWIRTCILSF